MAAVEAMGSGSIKTARPLLDHLVAKYPGWAEAWNKRATLAFLDKRENALPGQGHDLDVELETFRGDAQHIDVDAFGFSFVREAVRRQALVCADPERRRGLRPGSENPGRKCAGQAEEHGKRHGGGSTDSSRSV